MIVNCGERGCDDVYHILLGQGVDDGVRMLLLLGFVVCDDHDGECPFRETETITCT